MSEEQTPAWTAGSFSVATHLGQFPIAGWLKGLWALDVRTFYLDDYEDDDAIYGWGLSHIPTGYLAFGIIAPLERAFSIADAINGMADWDFVDASGSTMLKGIKTKVLAAFPNEVVSNSTSNRNALLLERAQ